MSASRLLLLILALVILSMAGREVYRWGMFREERGALVAMRERVVDAGAEVIRAESRLDTLGRALERADGILESDRRTLDRYARLAQGGNLSPGHYADYREELNRFNEKLRRRNARYHLWEAERLRGRGARERYRLLADSTRSLSREIGVPFYPVPSPVEAAVERRLLHPTP